MNIWLGIFLFMSLTLNILQVYTSMKKEAYYVEIQKVFDELKKHHNTTAKLVSKHSKLFGKEK